MSEGQRRVLVMDEMNRANLPRVLGELMYLFEYRNEESICNSRTSFSLPKEMLFIGTMNTADRSIRSIDVALRRRFESSNAHLIGGSSRGTTMATHTNSVSDLLDGFEALNAALTAELDRHHTIGHTFFMATAMTPASPERLATQIDPLIEEYFFDRPDLAADFTVEKFWHRSSDAKRDSSRISREGTGTRRRTGPCLQNLGASWRARNPGGAPSSRTPRRKTTRRNPKAECPERVAEPRRQVVGSGQ